MIRYYTFGDSAIEVGGTRIGPASSRAFAALLYLGAERNRRIPRVTLQGLLFPGVSEANAAHSLRQLLYRLRQLNVPVAADADALGLSPKAIADDYSLLLEARRFGSPELNAISGGFLPGYAPSFSRPFAEWCDAFRTKVTMQLRRVLVQQLAELRRVGDWREILHAAQACLALDSLNEEATLALAEALAMTGSKVQAVHLLDRFISEVQPAGHSVDLQARILRRRISTHISDKTAIAVHTELVGRSREIRLLRAHVAKVQAGKCVVVVIEGAHGVGKSRLVDEVTQGAALEGAHKILLSCRPADQSRPLSLLSELARELLTLPGALGISPSALATLNKLVLRGDSILSGTLAKVDPEYEAGSILQSFTDLVEALSAEARLVLALEDVHWADKWTIQVLARTLERPGASKLLLLLTTSSPRSIYVLQPHLGGRQESCEFFHLPLQPLDTHEATALVKSALGNSTLRSNELVEWCVQVGEGNPLFLTELARHHRAATHAFSIPPSLEEVLDQRVAQLSENELTVLVSVALLEGHAEVENIQRATRLPTYLLATILRRLESEGYIRLQRARVICAHRLIGESAIRRSGAAMKSLLRGAVAETLEQISERGDRVGALWLAAEHRAATGQESQALRLLRRCAGTAARAGHAVTALMALKKSAELARSEEEAVTIDREILKTAGLALEYATVLDTTRRLRTREAARVCRSQDPELEVAESVALLQTGQDASGTCGPLESVVQNASYDPVVRLDAARIRLVIAELSLDLPAALRIVDAVRQVPHSSDAAVQQRHSFDLIFHTAFGDRDSAEALALRMIPENWPERGDPPFDRVLGNVAFALFRVGRVDLALSMTEKLLERARTFGVPTEEHRCAAHGAAMLLDLGRLDEAERWNERASEAESRMVSPYLAGGHKSNQIRIAIARGRADEAADLLAQAMTTFPATTFGRHGVLARGYQLEISCLRGEHKLSHAQMDDLVQVHMHARTFGMHDDFVRALATALVLNGRQSLAERVIEEYVTIYRRDRFPASALRLRRPGPTRTQ